MQLTWNTLPRLPVERNPVEAVGLAWCSVPDMNDITAPCPATQPRMWHRVASPQVDGHIFVTPHSACRPVQQPALADRGRHCDQHICGIAAGGRGCRGRGRA